MPLYRVPVITSFFNISVSDDDDDHHHHNDDDDAVQVCDKNWDIKNISLIRNGLPIRPN